jgi:hypothetical protein
VSATRLRSSIAAVLCSLACAAPTDEQQPTVEPHKTVLVESEPEAGPRMLTPSDNTAAALLAAAMAITRVELCDMDTGEAIATLPQGSLDKLRAVLSEGEVSEGISAEPAWPIILRVEVEGRREPFIVQVADIMLRVKPSDAWSPAIADESGEIDWRIRDIAMDFELQDQLAQLLPDGLPSQPWHSGHDDGARPFP